MTSIHIPDMLYALLLALVLIYAVKYITGVFRAWAQGANEKQYRALAERAVAAQSEAQAAVAAMQTELSKIAASLEAVEKILRQVQ